MGFDKLLAPLAGMPLFAHSVRAFAACSMVDRIVVVARPGAAELFQEYSKVAASGREVEVIEGGGGAVFIGLEWVADVDGARRVCGDSRCGEAVDYAGRDYGLL